jgi:hypothetical protein
MNVDFFCWDKIFTNNMLKINLLQTVIFTTKLPEKNIVFKTSKNSD